MLIATVNFTQSTQRSHSAHHLLYIKKSPPLNIRKMVYLRVNCPFNMFKENNEFIFKRTLNKTRIYILETVTEIHDMSVRIGV